MPDLTKPCQELHGWKEIAHYLGVSVRTAQALEKDRGLPVHRNVYSPKAPVLALSNELDNWRASLATSSNTHTDDLQVASAVQEAVVQNGGDTNSVSDGCWRFQRIVGRRHWLRWSLFGGTALAAAFTASKLGPSDKPPTSHRVDGATLTVLASDGSVLWRHTFPAELNPGTYVTERITCKFADLDADGKAETLFLYAPLVQSHDRSLICFDAQGKQRWEFHPVDSVVDNLGRSFAPPYWPGSFDIIHSRSTRIAAVVVTSNHHYSFVDQIALLDGRSGKLLSEHWHRGHILHLAVATLDGEQEPSVFLGGVNDAPEYKAATLVVFDHRSISGATRNPDGGVYFQHMRPGSEKCVVFFPRTAINRDQEFNHVIDLSVTPNSIMAVVAEQVESPDPYVIYELNHSFEVVNVVLSNRMKAQYALLQKAGALPVRSPEAIAEELKSQVRVIRYTA